MYKNGRISLFSLTTSSHQFLTLIVVLDGLHRIVFVMFHASGVGTHMGGWKNYDDYPYALLLAVCVQGNL